MLGNRVNAISIAFEREVVVFAKLNVIMSVHREKV